MFSLTKFRTRPPLSLICGFNKHVDFCIWVLLQDGVQVSPFDQHPFKTNQMDVESWHRWLSIVTATQDFRLNWRVKNIDEKVNASTGNGEFMAQQVRQHTGLPIKYDPDLVRTQSELYYRWQQSQYEQALAILGDTDRNALPPLLWKGESERLEQLWQEYLPIGRSRSRGTEPPALEDFTKGFSEQFPTLGAISVHLIDYPVPVAYPVGSATVLLSLSALSELDSLKARLMTAFACIASVA